MSSSRPAFSHAQLLNVLKDTITGIVRQEGSDLTARQLSILLITQLDRMQRQTVRGLAAYLEISKPSVTRSLDRLSEFDLVRRLPDPTDRRSVLVGCTPAGDAYMAMLQAVLLDAAQRIVAPLPAMAPRAAVWL